MKKIILMMAMMLAVSLNSYAVENVVTKAIGTSAGIILIPFNWAAQTFYLPVHAIKHLKRGEKKKALKAIIGHPLSLGMAVITLPHAGYVVGDEDDKLEALARAMDVIQTISTNCYQEEWTNR